jgi:hypothetical protein
MRRERKEAQKQSSNDQSNNQSKTMPSAEVNCCHVGNKLTIDQSNQEKKTDSNYASRDWENVREGGQRAATLREER